MDRVSYAQQFKSLLLTEEKIYCCYYDGDLTLNFILCYQAAFAKRVHVQTIPTLSFALIGPILKPTRFGLL